jgi:Lectin C-type domain
MYRPSYLSILFVAVLANHMHAQQLPAAKNDALDPATSRFDAAVKKAHQEYENAVISARKQYIEELDIALKAAMKAEQLEVAIRFRDLKKAAEEERDLVNPPSPRAGREGSITFKGNQYRILLESTTWTEARAKCRKLGGDLAALDTADKREFFGKHDRTIELWVGASYDAKTNRWQWVNGSPVTKDAWAATRPQDNGPFAASFPSTMLLGDTKAENKNVKGYICEWKR